MVVHINIGIELDMATTPSNTLLSQRVKRHSRPIETYFAVGTSVASGNDEGNSAIISVDSDCKDETVACETNQDKNNIFADIEDDGDTVNSERINEYCSNGLGDAKVSSNQFNDKCDSLYEQSVSYKSDNKLDRSGTFTSLDSSHCSVR